MLEVVLAIASLTKGSVHPGVLGGGVSLLNVATQAERQQESLKGWK